MARNRRLVVSLLALTLLVAGTATAYLALGRREVTTSSAEAYRLYRKGRENENKLYRKDAIADYAEALKHDPHFAMATLRLAALKSDRGDREGAKSLLQWAAQNRDQLNPRETFVLRIFEERMGDRDPKVLKPLYDEYVRRYPNDPEAYILRAQFCQMQRRLDDALPDLERAIVENPNYAIAYNNLGYYWASRDDYAKSEDYFKRYRFLAPDQANPYDSLGELYANTGRYEEAEASLKKALSTRPDFIEAIAHLGTLEVARGNPAKAAEYFDRAANASDVASTRIEWRGWATLCLLEVGRRDDVQAKLEQIDREIAGAAESERKQLAKGQVALRAYVLARLGRLQEADQDLAAVEAQRTELKPDQVSYFDENLALLKGLIAGARGSCPEAIDDLRKALVENRPSMEGFGYYPVRLQGRLILADCLHRTGHQKEAEEALAPVLKRNPKFQPAVEMLARLQGRSPAAATAELATHEATSAR